MNAEEKVLNVYNWPDYIAQDMVANFTKETGIKVNYQTFENNEALHAKLVAGKTGYDIVVPGSHFAKTQIEGGLLQKLDRSKLSNWGNLDKGGDSTAVASALTSVSNLSGDLLNAWTVTTLSVIDGSAANDIFNNSVADESIDGGAGIDTMIGGKGSDTYYLGDDNEWLMTYCKDELKKEHTDYFIFGHRHLPLDLQASANSRYINLGEWINYCTYAEFDGSDLVLKKFEG